AARQRTLADTLESPLAPEPPATAESDGRTARRAARTLSGCVATDSAPACLRACSGEERSWCAPRARPDPIQAIAREGMGAGELGIDLTGSAERVHNEQSVDQQPPAHRARPMSVMRPRPPASTATPTACSSTRAHEDAVLDAAEEIDAVE